MRIDELKSVAEEKGYNTLKFKFTNLKGEEVNCQWLDAYMGMFEINGNEGFITVSQWKKFTRDAFEFEIVE